MSPATSSSTSSSSAETSTKPRASEGILSIWGPKDRVPEQRFAELGAIVVHAARQVGSAQLTPGGAAGYWPETLAGGGVAGKPRSSRTPAGPRMSTMIADWLADAVLYEIYPQSFADSERRRRSAICAV